MPKTKLWQNLRESWSYPEKHRQSAYEMLLLKLKCVYYFNCFFWLMFLWISKIYLKDTWFFYGFYYYGMSIW